MQISSYYPLERNASNDGIDDDVELDLEALIRESSELQEPFISGLLNTFSLEYLEELTENEEAMGVVMLLLEIAMDPCLRDLEKGNVHEVIEAINFAIPSELHEPVDGFFERLFGYYLEMRDQGKSDWAIGKSIFSYLQTLGEVFSAFADIEEIEAA